MESRFDTYYDNDQLVSHVRGLVDANDKIAELRALGTSHEGREIPLVVITNRETGPDLEKPGFWLDANIHATELTGAMAALTVLEYLTAGYGTDDQITRMVDEQVFYVVPRLNPDGAAWAMAEQPRYVRSGTRPFPRAYREDGLHIEDIDGDGYILQMRIEDPSGDWKESAEDPRLLVKRLPHEEGGRYFRLFPEGRIENYDGHFINVARPLEGLDFNRNFPSGWRPDGEQIGAGDFPGSEPEIRAVLEFMSEHPNVFGALTLHTFSRALLRPFSDKPDEKMDTNDLWVYETLGERGTEITGYPNVSVYHDFRYHPKETIGGAFDDWMYSHHGVFAFTVELWDLPTAAGITEKNDEKKFIEWFRTHPVEDDEKILAFVKEHAPGSLHDWRAFDHPELGPIELGGLDGMFTWRNPPPALLAAEIAPPAEFVVDFAAVAPRIRWRDVTVTGLDDGLHHVSAVVENVGFLSTSGSNHARKAGRIREVSVEIGLPAGAEIRRGQPRQEIGHLEGRSNKLTRAFGMSATDNRGRAEWLVHAPSGGTLTLTAVAERAGTIRRTVVLG